MTEEKNSGAEKELITKNLKKGEKLYIMDCSGCHAMHKPAEFTAAQWQPILSRMFVKSKISDTETQALITNYILSKSK